METFFTSGNCPIRDVIGRLGDKWSLLVLITLKVNGTMRFSDINRSIGDISQRMLTVTLRSLEADGLVSREIFPEVPPRVEYRLTELGSGLIPHVQNLANWAVTNMPDILACRERYEASKVL